MRHRSVRPQALAALVATFVVSSAGFGQPTPEARPSNEVTVPGKPSLRVWIGGEGTLEAEACKSVAACEKLTIKLPDAVRGGAGKATLHARKTAAGKSFVDVEIPVGARVFHALVAQKSGKPSLVWSGTSSERSKIVASADGTVIVEETAATCTGSQLHSRRELDGATLEMKTLPGDVPAAANATTLTGEATAVTMGLPLLRGSRREERALVDASETSGATLDELGPFGTFTTSQKVDVDGIGLVLAAPLAQPRTVVLRIEQATY